MQAPTNKRSTLSELKKVIAKMSLSVCFRVALPEFQLQVRDVTRAVRNARLPMTPASLAKVLRTHAANKYTPEDLDHILSQLTLKWVALSDERVWHTVELSDPLYEPEPVSEWSERLLERVRSAARRASPTALVRVHCTEMDDFVYVSVCRESRGHRGAALYAATCAGQRVAFVTSLASKPLVRAVIEGIGYKTYSDAGLYGRHVGSLLRIVDGNTHQLVDVPEYNPKPVYTKNGIDYTNSAYDKAYVDAVIGPDPPTLTNLDVQSRRSFYDPDRVDKVMRVTLRLKSADIARTLKHYVSIKAIPATSDLIKVFKGIKCNQITLNYENEDED